MSNTIINNKNDIEQSLKLYNENLAGFLFKDNFKKIIPEIKNIFNIIISAKDSDFSENAFSYLKNIIHIIDSFINKKKRELTLSILQEICFLLANIKSKKILSEIFSFQNNIINEQGINMNIFDKLISINDFNKNEEFLEHQINLMKSLILKLDSESILFFYKNEINYFPILSKSLLLYDYPDDMIHGAIHNILLLITKNNNKSLNEYLISFPVALYYPIIIFDLKKIISELNFIFVKEKNIFEFFEEKHEKLCDIVLYINDILLCNISNINFILINCLLNEIIFPLFNIIMSKTKENISAINAIYTFSFFVYYIKNDFIIDIISYFLLNNQIPYIFFEKIKKYKYKEINDEFLKDIISLIKNINDADINDQIWKRNADKIKESIGIDLSTGNRCQDNNFDFFKNLMINIQKNKKNDIDFIENEIFVFLKELMSSDDENIILNSFILLYNILNYYRNCDLKSNLFNPFLLLFIDFTKNCNSIKYINDIDIVKIVLNLIKKRNKFRIFTNELILNTLLLLIKIFCTEKHFFPRAAYNLIKEIKSILKEEINNLKLILNDESDFLPLNNIFFIYKYFTTQTFDSKILKIMKSYYILTIPFLHSENNDTIPFYLKEEKSKSNILNNILLNIFLLLEITQINNNKNNIRFPILHNENDKNNTFEIGKLYEKNNIGKEYAFCFIGNNYDDFKFNVQNIKKGLFIFSQFDFYLSEIISKSFKNIEKIKIITKIPIISLKVLKSQTEENFIEIKDLRNDNKTVINCFNNDNTKKVFNYLMLMIRHLIHFKKNEFNNFIKNIENKILI